MKEPLQELHAVPINHASEYFYIETIEVPHLSAIAFFEAGKEFKGERYYWQNRDNTKTIVGLGHLKTFTSNHSSDRFDDIQMQWNLLLQHVVQEKEDASPVLFGGFSFDPINSLPSEWSAFPTAFFAVAKFQLVIEKERSYLSIHYLGNEKDSAEVFESLRKQRDELIHSAQVKEWKVYVKHDVVKAEEILRDSYLEAVTNTRNAIRRGQLNKAVIARKLVLTMKEEVHVPSSLYFLSKEQPESYEFGLENGDSAFVGATPERLVKVEDETVFTTCLAGSIKRGTNALEDKHLGEELLADQKNLEEHQYVVKMISDVFDELCTDVKVPFGPKLMKTRDIQHLYTPIEGKPDNTSSIFQFVEKLHPTPALGGAPTEEAVKLIRVEEKMNRGYYAAPVGWVDARGNGEFVVAIRSALLQGKNAYLYAGGGIVANSTAEKEYAETIVKFRPMLRALGGNLDGI
ncbi:isochorismate synthase [Paenisporosarcina cavernae]|uniref:isochorismate synthase n=1 Tax=Paenisporosarcina cavernae TaxID=2320858 RepID=A0A385YSV4_9BACL|nr:isochorismate synthase [Paenisporosarcina cavernae]AYC29925.1 isochorismate synthase [Paenisporosarcina cavernae]